MCIPVDTRFCDVLFPNSLESRCELCCLLDATGPIRRRRLRVWRTSPAAGLLGGDLSLKVPLVLFFQNFVQGVYEVFSDFEKVFQSSVW